MKDRNCYSAKILLPILLFLVWTEIHAQPPPSDSPYAAEQQRRSEAWREAEREKVKKAIEALQSKRDPVDELAAKIRARIPLDGQPPLPPQKSFDGFILDDEELEREVWGAIRVNAMQARQIEPLILEVQAAMARDRAFPPLKLLTKTYKYGDTEADQVSMILHKALAAERRVKALAGPLSRTGDVRAARMFAFLLWEPGKSRMEDDVGHNCLRDNTLHEFANLIESGALDVGKQFFDESGWREWWLKNKWKWGWSYEIEPITDTKIFPAPDVKALLPKLAAAVPTPPTPAPVPEPKAATPVKPESKAAPPPIAVQNEPEGRGIFLYIALGVITLAGAIGFLWRKSRARSGV